MRRQRSEARIRAAYISFKTARSPKACHYRGQIAAVSGHNVLTQQPCQRRGGGLVAGLRPGTEFRPDIVGHLALQVPRPCAQDTFAGRAGSILRRRITPGAPSLTTGSGSGRRRRLMSWKNPLAPLLGPQGLRLHLPGPRRGSGVIVNIIGSAGEKFPPGYIYGAAGNAALMASSRARPSGPQCRPASRSASTPAPAPPTGW
jgi:hypothetical protein